MQRSATMLPAEAAPTPTESLASSSPGLTLPSYASIQRLFAGRRGVDDVQAAAAHGTPVQRKDGAGDVGDAHGDAAADTAARGESAGASLDPHAEAGAGTAESSAAAKQPTATGASWRAAARAYNQRLGLVRPFNAATDNACGSGEEADPDAVAAWQAAHGIPADGRIGPKTLETATRLSAAKSGAGATHPAASPPIAAPTTTAASPPAIATAEAGPHKNARPEAHAGSDQAKHEVHAQAAHPTEQDEHRPPTSPDGKEPAKSGKPKAFIPVGREVYAAGGRLSHEHLSHGHQTTDLTNKNPKKRTIHLDDEQYAFKQHCYDLAVARLGDHIYGGVAQADLGQTENNKPYRKDCVPHLASMLSAMRSDMSAGVKVTNSNGVQLDAPKNGGITVGSAYRSPEHDRDLWDGYFQRYFIETMAHRETMEGGPLGEKAAKWLVYEHIASRKAPPGGSNHSNGNAVDLVRLVNGKWQDNNYDDQRDWRASWEYFWLLANAKSHGFKNYPKEAWHWEWYA